MLAREFLVMAMMGVGVFFGSQSYLEARNHKSPTEICEGETHSWKEREAACTTVITTGRHSSDKLRHYLAIRSDTRYCLGKYC